MNGTPREIRDITISVLALGFGFSFLFFADGNPGALLSSGFLPAFVATTILVAISVVPHEMGHRVTARAIQAYSEFRLWAPGAVFAALTPVLGFVFAATGGVELHTRKGERYGRFDHTLDVKQTGLIAAVGPLMNLMLAVIFSFLADIQHLALQGQNLLVLSVHVNGFIAASNLVPFHPFDGYKIMRWDTRLWILLALLSGLVFLL